VFEYGLVLIGVVEAFKQLARGLMRFFEECSGDVEGGIVEDY
jgi:hypothetical protein